MKRRELWQRATNGGCGQADGLVVCCALLVLGLPKVACVFGCTAVVLCAL